MKTFALSKSRSQSGVALIVTLAFVVLLTFAVVAFFSRASNDRAHENSSANRIAADLLARSAADAVIGDLQAEMRVISLEQGGRIASNPGGIRGNGNLWMSGTGISVIGGSSYHFMRPQYKRNAPLTNNTENLIKQSGTGAMFNRTGSPIGHIISSLAIDTKTSSIDGRSIAQARWDLPHLTGLYSGTGWQQSFQGGLATPYWIYMSKSGIVSGTEGANNPTNPVEIFRSGTSPYYIIGRFAFNVYDVGGLTDISVAGSQINAAGAKANVSGSTFYQKGLMALMDFSQIDSIMSQTTPSAPSSFTTWRNAYSGGTNSYRSYLGLELNDSSVTTNTNFLMYGTRRGFIDPATAKSVYPNQSASTNTSDNNFVSRQDLINATGTNSSAPLTGLQGALPKLTQFNRAFDAPGIPTLSSSTQDITQVRVSGTFMRSDGSMAYVGEPLVKRRFPLSRILGLTGTGINSAYPTTLVGGTMTIANATTILRDFGLVWDPTNSRYVYVGHPSTIPSPAPTTSTTIAQLNSIKGREPDFFELLKAALAPATLTGTNTSLGNFTTVSGSTGMGLYLNYVKFDAPNAVLRVDRHIFQIGANIIDQYDPDNIPTRIASNIATPGYPQIDIFGVENHPYIQAIYQAHFRRFDRPPNVDPKNDPNGLDVYPTVGNYHLFQLWNPHANPDQTSYQYRIVPVSGRAQVVFTWQKTGSNNRVADKYSTYPTSAYSSSNTLITGTIAFSTPTKTVAPYLAPPYGEYPFMLTGSNVDPSGTSPNCRYNGSTSSPKLVGMWLGDAIAHNNADVADPGGSGGNNSNDYEDISVSISQNTPVVYELQLKGSDSKWRTIQQFGLLAEGLTQHLYKKVPAGTLPNLPPPPGLKSMSVNQDALFWYGYAIDHVSSWQWLPPSQNPQGAQYGWAPVCAYIWSDPRTLRGGIGGTDMTVDPKLPGFLPESMMKNSTLRNKGYSTRVFTTQLFYPTSRWTRAANPTVSGTVYAFSDLAENDENSTNWQSPDGRLRYGDNKLLPNNTASNNSLTWWTYDPFYEPQNIVPPTLTTSGRPVFLNRPFQSLGELGYVFRGEPWKTLDLSSKQSGDAELLNVFSTREEATLIAGKFNVNGNYFGQSSSNPENLGSIKAMLNNTSRILPLNGAVASTVASNGAFRIQDTNGKETSNLAAALKSITSNTSAMISPAELVLNGTTTLGPKLNSWSANDDKLKPRRESIVRALADTAQTRTWNVMIDLVAQSGKLTVTATNMSQFNVTGEQHYWIHAAIDRFTGEVIDKQVEVVKE